MKRSVVEVKSSLFSRQFSQCFRLIIGLLLSCLVSLNLHAFGNAQPLRSEEAFQFSVSVVSADKITVNWKIAPGYYLYRDRLHFDFTPKVIADIKLPKGELKQRVNQPSELIYANQLSIPITLHSAVASVQLGVSYQGCSAKGFCYPPTHQLTTLDLSGYPHSVITQETSPSLQSLLTDQFSVKALFDSTHFGMTLLIFFGMGLLLAFTPCVLPMIPILTGIIIGHKQPVSTQKATWLSVTYVLGAAITYAIAGVIAASMGSSLQAWLQQPWIIAATSSLFVILSLSLFGFYDLRLPNRWQNRITAISRKQQGGTYLGVFIMGMVSTLIVSPCVTAPLVGVLMYIAQSGNQLLGASALFAMGIGMGVPLVLIGASTGKYMPKRGPWMILVQKVFGVMMLGMAVWLLMRVASMATISVFLSILLFAGAVYLAVTDVAEHPKSWYQKLSGSVVLMLVLSASTFTMPHLIRSVSTDSPLQVDNSAFTVVHSVADLTKQLTAAREAGKPVLLDFYADWCESCVSMDKKVFNEPAVINKLGDFVLLRADLSANDKEDEALLKKYEVIAPPTVLLFNDSGKEVNSHRMVGELDAQEFMTRINTFITASCDKSITC